MPIKLIHVSDIHFGSGESHGRVNPASGLNVRFEDFALALSRVVDFSIENNADIFLFSGDAYKNASPEPVYQQAFARQLKRLSDAAIPTILLVGNHDQILKAGASHSMSVFQSLEVPGVTIIAQPTLLKIASKHGELQIIGLPHVTRNLLMTHEKYAQLSPSELDRVLVSHVGEILEGFYEELNPEIPTLVTAHLMLDSARAGAEQELMLGYSMSFPLCQFLDERLDYVALGHVHAHQVLHEKQPLVAYAGSLDRVDFSEEKEDKGFIEADIERGNVNWRFHSLQPRPFITFSIDLSESENPMEELYQAVLPAAKDAAVFRIKYKIQQNRLPEIDEDRIRAALPQLLSLRFKAELIYTERPRRLPELNEKAVFQPLQALEKYLEESSPENKDALMEKARMLISKAQQEE
ncbi:MAG: exonuclease SbcCD subunit D [Candidatus Obscuribacterales bacterium]|nr:exonuclease SbcCD subunit D [Candidatus Obscuribacterales bacterium]